VKKATRRVYMSILLVVLSIFTAVATTFAWVGITSNTTFDKFRINLRPNEEDEQSEYGIQLSLTGEKNDFHDEIPAEDLYRRILLNMGYTDYQITRYGGPIQVFRSINLQQCTVARSSLENPSTSGRFTDFYDMNGLSLINAKNSYGDFITARGFIFFDLYLSIYSLSDSVTTTAPTIFLKNDLLTSDTCSTYIMNSIKLDNYFSNEIYGKTTVSAANACRVGVQRYDIVGKGDLSKYSIGASMHPNRLTIYQTGSMTPRYDSRSDIYDFGGIMSRGDNFAYKYYESIYGDTFDDLEAYISLEERIKTRGDVIYENGSELDSTNMLLPYKPSAEGYKDGGITSNDMVKFRFYFWFEGWDGDCMEAIDKVPVNLNLVFSTKTNISD